MNSNDNPTKPPVALTKTRLWTAGAVVAGIAATGAIGVHLSTAFASQQSPVEPSTPPASTAPADPSSGSSQVSTEPSTSSEPTSEPSASQAEPSQPTSQAAPSSEPTFSDPGTVTNGQGDSNGNTGGS